MRKGTVLAGRYQLDRLLGRGGMGQVWQGADRNLRRRVAIKLLLADLLADERSAAQALRRFRREGEAAARLNHRNIAAIHDLGEHREDHPERTWPFLVLEYLDGRDLKTLLNDAHPHGLPMEDVLDYGAQACDALAAAHSAGIVHRDIKPANLMLLSDGTLKVCDFGIARLHDATAGLSATGVGIGTLAYMPPEQLDGRPIDHRADLYALGATLYHLLTGRPVFPADDLRALAYMHATRDPVPPSAHQPAIPPELDALITALLAKDPQQRPSTAAHTADGLRALTRTETEHVPKGRIRAARETSQLRAAIKRERDEILTAAKRQADEMRAQAQRILEESEAQRAQAEAEFEIQLAARREEAERQDVERHAAMRAAAQKLVAEAEQRAASAEQRAAKASQQAEQVLAEAEAEAERIRTAAQRRVDELTRQRDSITRHLEQLRRLIADEIKMPGKSDSRDPNARQA